MDVPLTSEQEKLLEQVAARQQRSKTTVAAEAIEAYLDHERWFRDQVEQGRAASRRGEMLDHDEVVQRIEQRFGRP
jgi:predicted transcriptional regulator